MHRQATHHAPTRRRAQKSRAGFTLVEVTVALAVLSVVMGSFASAFLASIRAVGSAKRTNQGALFLETVLEDLAAQPYESLSGFDGDRVFDKATQNLSNYAVDLNVFTASLELTQVEAVLTDLQTSRVISRVSTLRSKR